MHSRNASHFGRAGGLGAGQGSCSHVPRSSAAITSVAVGKAWQGSKHVSAISRRRRGRAATAAAAPSTAAPAAALATPLPLLPFFDEFRSQVARLEGVATLPVPPHLAAATSAAPPVGVRCGACHADRLRFGQFLYLNAGPINRQRGRPRGRGPATSTNTGSSSSRGSSGRGCMSLLQGELLPSLFSFHPPLIFQVVAFDGGTDWMVAVEYVLASSWGGIESQPAASSGGDERGDYDGAGGLVVGTALAEAGAWQAKQAQRLAALRGMYVRAAAADPAPARRPAAQLLLSSAALQAETPAARRAALEGAGLPAFRAALSVHLNGLAAAPADASPSYVAHTAAAQRRLLAETAARPLLCTAQLVAAFGQGWVEALQEHRVRSGQEGLEAAVMHGSSAAQQQREQQRRSEFVYFAPRQALGSSDEG